MLSNFDDRFNDDVIDMLSSINYLFPREISSTLRIDEENVIDFNKLVGHFRGGITNEYVKGSFKIDLDKLKIDLKENVPIEGLNKLTIKDFCTHVFKDRAMRANANFLHVIACALPFSCASCERSFSALKITKTRLRSAMEDVWLDYLLCFCIEDYLLKGIVSSDKEMEKVVEMLNFMQPKRVAL